MRRRLVWFAVAAACVCGGRPATAQDDAPYAGFYDRDMTVAAGAADLLTVHRAIAALEDRWLPPQRFDESRILTRGLGIAYRFGKWFGLDLPQDHFLIVAGHEVFGHGSRLREIGARGIRYGFDAPIPYGGGGAVTSFSGDLLVTRADALAIDTSGIESQNALADAVARHALAGGALPYRDGWLYLESRLDGLRYIRSVSPRSGEGHDVRSFLEDFNDECDPPACAPIEAAALKRRALLMLADPMLAYAGYTWGFAYLVRGRSSAALPMIPLPGGTRYLPALRFEMTPYGTALTTEHAIVRRGRLTTVSIGVGDTGLRRAWQASAAAMDVVRTARARGDIAVSVWQQPALDSPPNAQRFASGALGAATVHIPLGRAAAGRAAALVQVGYKSDGFVRGERLHAGPILRIGATFHP